MQRDAAESSAIIGLTTNRVNVRNMTRYYSCNVGNTFVRVTTVFSKAVGMVVTV